MKNMRIKIPTIKRGGAKKSKGGRIMKKSKGGSMMKRNKKR
jgi:hypothetical protein